MEFYQVLILIIAGTIAIRFTFKFDLNKFLEDRRNIRIDQLKNLCPHAEIVKEGERFGIKSFFVSPFGTTKYVCSQCGAIVDSAEYGERTIKLYLENPRLLTEKQKRFVKKAKKLKII